MGTLRVHFTPADLARTHVAAAPDPFWEIVLSLHVLQGEHQGPAFREWRRSLPSGQEGRAFARLVSQLLAPVCPSAPYFPDFVTPTEGLAGFEAGLDAVLSTPRHQLRQELGALRRYSGRSTWLGSLAQGDRSTLRRFEHAVRSYHRLALLPYWEKMVTRIHADSLLRHRVAGRQGVQGMLSSMEPIARWRAPVLEVNNPVDRDLYLDGRGLTLIPTYFGRNNPICLWRPDVPQVLVYPAARLGHIFDVHEANDMALDRLIGTTRACVLQACRMELTTTELAAQVGISPASASEHASVLRASGLIASHRDGRAVVHTRTPLGDSLWQSVTG